MEIKRSAYRSNSLYLNREKTSTSNDLSQNNFFTFKNHEANISTYKNSVHSEKTQSFSRNGFQQIETFASWFYQLYPLRPKKEYEMTNIVFGLAPLTFLKYRLHGKPLKENYTSLLYKTKARLIGKLLNAAKGSPSKKIFSTIFPSKNIVNWLHFANICQDTPQLFSLKPTTEKSLKNIRLVLSKIHVVSNRIYHTKYNQKRTVMQFIASQHQNCTHMREVTAISSFQKKKKNLSSIFLGKDFSISGNLLKSWATIPFKKIYDNSTSACITS